MNNQTTIIKTRSFLPKGNRGLSSPPLFLKRYADTHLRNYASAPFRDLELDGSVLALPMRQQHVDGDAPRNNASISYLLLAADPLVSHCSCDFGGSLFAEKQRMMKAVGSFVFFRGLH
jgi:hypothetical protein